MNRSKKEATSTHPIEPLVKPPVRELHVLKAFLPKAEKCSDASCPVAPGGKK
jgi:hypothetical protein